MIKFNLSVRYSATFGEVDILGGSRDLEGFADFLESGDGELATEIGEDPAPYQVFLSIISARQQEGKVVLSVDVDRKCLHIGGSPEFLAVMADNIRDLGQMERSGEHLHIEYFADHFYLADSQISLSINSVSG